MSFSTSTRGALVDWICGGSNPTRPSVRYLALYSAVPSDDAGGTELSTGGYARQEVTFAAWNGTAALNDVTVTFSCSGADWGSVVAGALFDAPTDGNFLMWAQFTAPPTITDGDGIEFVAGTVAVGLT